MSEELQDLSPVGGQKSMALSSKAQPKPLHMSGNVKQDAERRILLLAFILQSQIHSRTWRAKAMSSESESLGIIQNHKARLFPRSNIIGFGLGYVATRLVKWSLIWEHVAWALTWDQTLKPKITSQAKRSIVSTTQQGNPPE